MKNTTPKTTRAKRTTKVETGAGSKPMMGVALTLGTYVNALERANGATAGSSPEAIARRLDAARKALPGTSGMKKIQLMQKIADLTREQRSTGLNDRMQQLEDKFVEHGLAYSRAKGIEYTTWRQAGVPAEVLQRAGISRSAS